MLAWKYPEFANLIFDQGFYSSSHINEWINEILNRLLPNVPHPVSFRSLPIPTYIVSTDLTRSEAKIWSQIATPNELVANAVQASCAIPIFFQPIEERYVDGGLLSNLPAFIFSGRETSDRPLSTRVLAFSLSANEEEPTTWGTLQFLKLLLNAIIDGSQKLQLDQQKDVHTIRIPTSDIKATDFRRMTAALTQSLVDNGTRAARQFFDEELRHVRSARSNTSVCYGTEELYTHVTDGLDISLERIVIAEDNTNWVYPLFPSLLTWVMKGVRLQVLLPEHGDNPRHGPYRRRLLGALGVDIKEIRGASSVPVRTYILDSKDPAQIKAVVGIERGSAHGIEAVVYTGVLDSPVIRSVLLQVEQHLDTDLASPTPPSIISGGQDQLLKYLSGVGQYAKSGVDLTLENVALDRMVSLTRFVREYKYKQIHRKRSSDRTTFTP
jgi:hypothetical protein